MDRSIRLALLILVGALTSAPPARADVAYAPYNLGESALDIAGRSYRLFTLTLTGPAPLTVSVHSTDFDPVLVLISPEGRPWLNDDALGYASSLSIPDAAPGAWYLAVRSYAPDGAGEFTLAVTPADAAVTPSDAAAGADAALLASLIAEVEALPAGEPGDTAIFAQTAYYRGMVAYPADVTASVAPAPDSPEPRPTNLARQPLPPTELPPLLPWPPPEPSARMEIPKRLFLRSGPAPTLGDIDDQLRAALAALGYNEVGYFGVHDGFALVTRLERFEPGGATIADPSRWTFDVPPLRTFDLLAYVKALFTAQTGHFRVLVFVVTPMPFGAATEAAADTETLQRWALTGNNALPAAVTARPFGDAHFVAALVYEFSKVRGGRSVELELPSAASAHDHLTASGIMASLGGG